MRNILAIFKREMGTYFSSPIAYVVITMFLLLSGGIFAWLFLWFAQYSFQSMQNPYMMSGDLNLTEIVVREMGGAMSWLLMVILPALTMRLLAEEKRSGTAELLFTFPVRDREIILGKYLAALAVYLIMLLGTATQPILMAAFGEPELAVVGSGYLGLVLMGMAILALGTLVSSLTENQIVALVGGYGVLVILLILGPSSEMIDSGFASILSHISLTTHFENFTKGLLDTRDVVYYLSFTFTALFLTGRVLDSRKWRG